MRIEKTHDGPFTLRTGGVYELYVSNAGSGPIADMVTVTDPLPPGLRLRSAGGSGWDCTTSTPTLVTCTRSDGLPAGAGYPSLLILVDIAANAVLPIENIATVTALNSGQPSSDSSEDVIDRLSQPAPAPLLSPVGLALAAAVLICIAGRRMRAAGESRA